MNRFFILLTWLLIVYVSVPAQVPSNQNIPANLSYMARPSESFDTANENRLIAFALKGPEYNASIHQSKINEYGAGLVAKLSQVGIPVFFLGK